MHTQFRPAPRVREMVLTNLKVKPLGLDVNVGTVAGQKIIISENNIK